ncbi:MAG: hypothetical protein RR253_06820, partial [Oscillospiraceae bacterium]
MFSWTPLACFTAIAAVYACGDFLSNKTKGYISSMVFAAIIGLAMFWLGVFPKDIAVNSTLTATLSGYAVALLLVNMGTSIDLESLLAEWKTVLICCAGLVGIGILSFTVGIFIFGREYALTAAPPIAGGVIAYQIVAEVATANGRLDLAGYAALVMALQGFVGMPIASICLKKELSKMYKDGHLSADYTPEKAKKLKIPETRIFHDVAVKNDTPTLKFAKLGLVAIVAYMFSSLTKGFINVNISYLIFGVIFRKINFLPKNGLQSAGGYGICSMALYALLFNGFSGVSPSDFLAMIWPIAGMLLLGATGICVLAVVAGKMVGYSPAISIAVGITAMFGYPGT